MTTRSHLLACCRDAADAAAPGTSPPCFLSVPSGPQFGSGPVIAILNEPPPWDLRAAVHESGHSVASAMVGGVPGRVTVVGQANAHIGAAGMSRFAEAVATLAGPFAGRLEHRQEYRLRDGEWQPFLDRVRSGSPGRCDECVVARLGIVAGCPAGRLATDEEALRWLRRAEVLTIEMLREPSVWTAVRRLAARLREVGTVDGEAVKEIVSACVDAAVVADFREKLK